MIREQASKVNPAASWQVLLVLFFILMGCSEDPTLHLVGDSTMAIHPVTDTPERGWGQEFPRFFSEELKIINHARNGRSTKRFIDEGRWQAVIDSLRPGDYVFIQFGHNDAKKSDPKRYAAPHGAYRTNLIMFIEQTRAQQAKPVLITPVCRRKFDQSGQFVDSHKDYPDVVRDLSIAYETPLIDLHARSMDWLIELGPAASDSMFMNAPPGMYKKYPEGKNDNTHFNERGAIEVGLLVLDEMKRNDLPLLKYRLDKVR